MPERLSTGLPRLVSAAVLSVFLLPPGAAAQTPAAQSPGPPTTRAEQLRQLRETKAKDLHHYRPSGLETVAIRMEDEILPRLFAARSGFYPFIGSISSGSWIAAGPGYRVLDLWEGKAHWNSFGAISLRGYYLLDTRLTFPNLKNGRFFAETYARHSRYRNQRFFGLGPDSPDEGEATFVLDQTNVGGFGGVRVAPIFSVGGGLEFLKPDVARFENAGEDEDDPPPPIFDDRTAPGLAEQPSFLRWEAFADLNYATPRGNPRRGGQYQVSFSRYHDQDSGLYGFNRTNVDLRQYLSAFNERRVLVLRSFLSLSDARDGARVPFYLQRTLGGGTTLRGFDDFRFRDANLLLLQAEYRYEIFTALDGALFYDAGQVAPERRDFSRRKFERDWGLGFRFGSNAGVFMRFDFAFAEQGTRFTMAFSNVF